MQVPLKVNHNFEVTLRGTGLKFGLELIRLDTDAFKSWVHERLAWPEDELGSWYIPQDTDDEYLKQIVSESRTRLASGKVLWVKRSEANHFLDCEAMQAAAAHLLNFARRAPTATRRPPPSQVSPHMVDPNRKVTPASRLAR